MFTADDVCFLDVECVGRVSVPAAVCLGINRKADIGTDIIVSTGSIIVDIELTAAVVLYGAGHDLCCRAVVRSHPSCSVDDGT